MADASDNSIPVQALQGGLQSARLSTTDQQQLHQAAIDAGNSHIDLLERLHQRAQAAGSGTEQRLLARHLALARQGLRHHGERLAGRQVYEGAVQARRDAAALAAGRTTPEELGAERFSNQFALTGHPGIDYVDHDIHAGGASPVGAAIGQVHDAAALGDWAGVRHAGAPLIAPHVSAHAPWHELHYAGVNGPFDGPYGGDGDDEDTLAAPIRQAADILGAKHVLHAVAQHPQAMRLLLQAHEEGATERQRAALAFVHHIGGPQRLGQFGRADGYEQQFQHEVAAGAEPRQAAEELAQRAAAARFEQLREDYLHGGLPLPPELRLAAKEKAASALVRADTPRSQASLLVYAPQAYAAGRGGHEALPAGFVMDR